MAEIIKITINENRMYCTEVGGSGRQFCTLRQSRLKNTRYSKVPKRFKPDEIWEGKIEELWDEPRHGYSGKVRILEKFNAPV